MTQHQRPANVLALIGAGALVGAAFAVAAVFTFTRGDEHAEPPGSLP